MLTRPCDPDDVVLCVERLIREGRMGPQHTRVLGLWGKQGVRPCRPYGGVQDEAPWAEAMMMLGASLKAKGIISHSSK